MLEQIRFRLKNGMIVEVNEDGFTLYQENGKTWAIDATDLAVSGEVNINNSFFFKAIKSKVIKLTTLQSKTNV